MADLVDNMTAAELRTKLAEYGLPVMPITASTRNLMAKKLKLVMESKAADKKNDTSLSKNNARRNLARYSSGEDSDLDTNVTKEKPKNRRATTTGAMLPPPSNKLRKSVLKKSDSPAKIEQDRDSESDSEPSKTHEEVETVTTRRITRTFAPSAIEREDYETGSDSDVDNAKPSSASRKSPTGGSDDYLSGTSGSGALKRSPLRSSATPPAYTPSYVSSENLNSIRSRLGLTQNYGDKILLASDYRSSLGSDYKSSLSSDYRSSLGSNYKSTLGSDYKSALGSDYKSSLGSDYKSTYASGYKAPTVSENIESPYLSNFTYRLSALKAQSQNAAKDSSDNTNGSGSYARRPYYNPAYGRRVDPDFKTAGEKNVLKNNLVSFAIIGIVLFFFVCVSFAYMGMKSDVTYLIDDANNVIPICQPAVPSFIPTVNCVDKDKVAGATTLLQILYPALKSRAEDYICGRSDKPPFINEFEIVSLAAPASSDDRAVSIIKDLHNLHVLIINNPKWGISILSTGASQTAPVKLTGMDYVVAARQKGNVVLGVSNPAVPWSCLLYGKLYSLILISVLLVAVTSAIYAITRGVRKYLAYRKSITEQIYSMVEQITDLLSQDSGEEEADPAGHSMPVSHVRDALIPVQNREKTAAVWDAAIAFLEKNESRVRFEVDNVAGEEYRTMRWVSAQQGSPRAGRGAKAWQGQAFETQEGSVNNLTISPTQCLKIRHMVDKNDKSPSKTVVSDAILEKCRMQCKILHIEIDRSSCCVYVKCASQADAGIVYQNLHGWWYEGNLITVKYLRLERYMDHFPLSPSSGPYIKLSTQSGQ